MIYYGYVSEMREIVDGVAVIYDKCQGFFASLEEAKDIHIGDLIVVVTDDMNRVVEVFGADKQIRGKK